MHRFYFFIQREFRHIARDQMLTLFLLAPVLLFAFVRWGVPAMMSAFPVVREYYPYVAMFGAMQTSIMMGFISAFILLEEKDEQIMEVLRILPLGSAHFLVYRLTGATLLAMLSAGMVIGGGGLVQVSFFQGLLLAMQFGLVAPLLFLIVAIFAKNKIEGLAYFKIIDLLILLPILTFFFPGWFIHILALVPVYWSFHAYDAAIAGNEFGMWIIAGTLVYGIAFIVLGHLFKKKVWRGS